MEISNMVTLNEGIKIIHELSNLKGWNRNVDTKIYYAILELGEAGNAWKHRDNSKVLMKDYGITPNEVPRFVANEIIDTFQFLFDGLHCLGIYDADKLFEEKVEVILNRNRIYPDNVREHGGQEDES